VISGFHHEVDEKCALLGYYTMSSGNFLDEVLGQSSGEKLPLFTL
jgi:hypothetical protein